MNNLTIKLFKDKRLFIDGEEFVARPAEFDHLDFTVRMGYLRAYFYQHRKQNSNKISYKMDDQGTQIVTTGEFEYTKCQYSYHAVEILQIVVNSVFANSLGIYFNEPTQGFVSKIVKKNIMFLENNFPINYTSGPADSVNVTDIYIGDTLLNNSNCPKVIKCGIYNYRFIDDKTYKKYKNSIPDV